MEPFLPAIVGAMHAAFSISTGSTFTIGIVATGAAAGLVLLLRDAPATAVTARSPGSRDEESAGRSASAA